MNKLTLAMTLAATLYAPMATANMQDLQKDAATCEQYVSERMHKEREARTTSRAVTTGANILGSIIAHGNASSAVGNAVRFQGYSIANDVRMEESRKQMYMNQCIRELQTQRR